MPNLGVEVLVAELSDVEGLDGWVNLVPQWGQRRKLDVPALLAFTASAMQGFAIHFTSQGNAVRPLLNLDSVSRLHAKNIKYFPRDYYLPFCIYLDSHFRPLYPR